MRLINDFEVHRSMAAPSAYRNSISVSGAVSRKRGTRKSGYHGTLGSKQSLSNPGKKPDWLRPGLLLQTKKYTLDLGLEMLM